MRVACLAAILAVLAPSALLGQQAWAPQANPVDTTYLQGAAVYVFWLKAAFDSIPAAKYGYKPTPAQQSIGYIAQHLETANYLLCGTFGGEPHPVSAKDSLADTAKA